MRAAPTGGLFFGLKMGPSGMSTSSTIIEEDIMTMTSPPHPGELLDDTLQEIGVTISAAARGLGITRQQLHNVIAGRSGISAEMAVRLEKAIGGTADTWLKLQLAYDLAEARKRPIDVKRLAPA